MRISDNDRACIRAAVVARDPSASIYLYGSRVNDGLKGGDIDLLVLSDQLSFHDKLDLLFEIKSHIGDQRIDLTLRPARAAHDDPFVASILPGARPL